MPVQRKLKVPQLKSKSSGPRQIKKRVERNHRLGYIIAACFAAVGVIFLVMSKAAVPTGTYTNWNWPAAGTGYFSIEHGLVVEEVTPNAPYFWSHQFQIYGGDGGYIGIQSNGNSINKQVGKTAVFSIFGAGIEGTPGNCEVTQAGFDGGLYGAGTSCRIPYQWTEGHAYALKAGITSSDASTVTWTGTIADFTAGGVTTIGQIKVPNTWKGVGFWSSMWTEYFGAQPATCEAQAYSRVRFLKPTVNGSVSPVSKGNTYAAGGTCATSKITDQPDGSTVQEMGARQTPAPAPAPAPTPTTDSGANPYGWLDEVSCSAIGGWAKDNDTNGPIDVHIYFEQPLGVAGSVGWNIGSANVSSSDVGSHRFRKLLTDPSITINPFDGQVHRVYAYGINNGSGSNPELSMDPRPRTFGPCTSPNAPAPTPTPAPTPAPAPTPTQPLPTPTLPVVSISSVSKQSAPATYTLTATASDSDGIKSVSFYQVKSGSAQKDTLIGVDTSAPYSIVESSKAEGTYQYYAVATDKSTSASTANSAKTTVVVAAAPTPTQPTPPSTSQAPAAPQLPTTTSVVTVTVVDPKKQPVPGARVEIAQQQAITNADGEATFSGVESGSQTVTTNTEQGSVKSDITVATDTTDTPQDYEVKAPTRSNMLMVNIVIGLSFAAVVVIILIIRRRRLASDPVATYDVPSMPVMTSGQFYDPSGMANGPVYPPQPNLQAGEGQMIRPDQYRQDQ